MLARLRDSPDQLPEAFASKPKTPSPYEIRYVRLPTLVRWSLVHCGQHITNGAENNMRLARRAAEHAQRMHQQTGRPVR